MVPPAMVKVPADVPSAWLLLMFKVPLFRVVPPVWVLTPDRVHVPGPFLVTVPDAVPMIPAMLLALV